MQVICSAMEAGLAQYETTNLGTTSNEPNDRSKWPSDLVHALHRFAEHIVHGRHNVGQNDSLVADHLDLEPNPGSSSDAPPFRQAVAMKLSVLSCKDAWDY